MKEFLPQLIASGILLFLMPLSKYLVGKLIMKYGELLKKPVPRMRQTKRIVNILLNVLFICMFIIVWGVEPENLLVGLSSVFAVIGVALFAQWSVLSNVTAGIVMYFTAPFHVGDRIRIIDKDVPLEATIEDIQAFYVHMRTDDDELVTLPNNQFLQKVVSVKKRPEDL